MNPGSTYCPFDVFDDYGPELAKAAFSDPNPLVKVKKEDLPPPIKDEGEAKAVEVGAQPSEARNEGSKKCVSALEEKYGVDIIPEEEREAWMAAMQKGQMGMPLDESKWSDHPMYPPRGEGEETLHPLALMVKRYKQTTLEDSKEEKETSAAKEENNEGNSSDGEGEVKKEVRSAKEEVPPTKSSSWFPTLW